ncbi:MAG: hypothetical protein KDB10_17060 [Acidimicrobiales bacterium]|nr:hypothetical protein [Acidimicrobiales bacterium]
MGPRTGERAGRAVLSAKLSPPAPRAGAVPRRGLVDALEAAGPGRLRVVVAPPGWGKSELVAQWLERHDGPVAYVQVDAHDADAARFWLHVLVAVEGATGVGVNDLVEAVNAPGVPLVTDVVEPLLARLDAAPVTLVLEDLHLADDVELDETLIGLVEARPAGLGLVVISRAEPPFALARLRMQDALCEIRREDLAVDVDAARSIVAGVTGTVLSDEAAARLVARTEGWAAGVYLAALALPADADVAEALDRFAGDDRNLSDYLAAEVLARLDEADRRFLLGVAVLEQLDAERCDALLGATGSGARLVALARRNQFLIPLDRAAGRYRFHHLFREWLLAELDRTSPGAVADAHRRAAVALRRQGDIVASTDHALAAGDASLAYESVVAHQIQLLDTCRHATAIRWYRALPPPPSDDAAAEVDLVRAYAAGIEGDPDTMDRLADRVAARLAEGTVTERVTTRSDEPPLLRAYAAMLRGDFDRCEAELARIDGERMMMRSRPMWRCVVGIVAFWLGVPARDTLEGAEAFARSDGVPYAVVLAQVYLALEAAHAGDLDRAERWSAAAEATAHDEGVSVNYLAAALVARAQVRQARGDLVAAAGDAARGVALAERRNDRPVAAQARLVLAAVRHLDADRGAARELVEVVAGDLEPMGRPGILGEALATAQRQLRLQQAPTLAPVTGGVRAPVEALTDRELALLRLLPGDLTQRELGDALHLSFNTVKAYNRQIYRKLGVSSRDQAVAAARAVGLL